MSDTPRTDAALLALGPTTGTRFVDAEFARNIEKELVEMTARAVSLVAHIPPHTMAGELQKWRDDALKLLAAKP